METVTSNEMPWYIFRTQPNCERKAETALERFEVEHYLPLFESERQWSDRVKTLKMPLIPGYIFVRGVVTDLFKVYNEFRQYFKQVLRVENKLATLRNEEIERLRKIARIKNIVVETCISPTIKGDEVVVLEGTLKGLTGIVRDRDKGKLIIYFKEFQCFTKIALPEGHLQKLSANRHKPTPCKTNLGLHKPKNGDLS